MIKLADSHFGADVFAHRDERYSNDSQSLVQVVILFGVQVIVAVVEHVLHFQHVARAGERADVDKNESLFADWRFDSLERLNRGIRRILTTCSSQSQARGH